MLTDLNQGLLRTLGVSHESINKALEILNGYGFKGKLTGAGGGGCLFAVIKPGNYLFILLLCKTPHNNIRFIFLKVCGYNMGMLLPIKRNMK